MELMPFCCRFALEIQVTKFNGPNNSLLLNQKFDRQKINEKKKAAKNQNLIMLLPGPVVYIWTQLCVSVIEPLKGLNCPLPANCTYKHMKNTPLG
jgi:hypothetical protein